MTVILDSTALIDALRKKPACVQAMQNIVAAGDILATSAVNVAEIYAGLRRGEEDGTQRLLTAIAVYPVTYSIARRAGELKNAASRRGATLQLDDMIVAATALEQGLPVWTDNKKDFAVPGLNFYKPS